MKTVAGPGVAERLVARLARLQPERRRCWGTMSPHEMLCHLADTSEGVLGLRQKPLPEHIRNRPVVKAVGLWLPFPWRGQRTGRWNDPRVDGSRPTDFSADRERAIRGVRRIAAATGGLSPAHGVFGRMSVRDWQRYTYRHTHYHLRQFGV